MKDIDWTEEWEDEEDSFTDEEIKEMEDAGLRRISDNKYISTQEELNGIISFIKKDDLINVIMDAYNKNIINQNFKSVIDGLNYLEQSTELISRSVALLKFGDMFGYDNF